MTEETYDFASQYDYCMVFAGGENSQLPPAYNRIVNIMESNGLELFAYLDQQNNYYVLIRASVNKLRAFANDIGYAMLLDPEHLEKVCKNGIPSAQIKSIEIPHVPHITSLKPHHHIYAKYSLISSIENEKDLVESEENLYWKDSEVNHPFRESVRMKLIPMIIETKPMNNTAAIKIRKLVHSGDITAFFPLHNPKRSKELRNKWRLYPVVSLPIYEIKEYFGEKIALYYVFLGHITNFLVFPALAGLGLQIVVFMMDDYSAPFLPPFALLIALWAIVMLEYWKRKEKSTALIWGVLDFEKNERSRPEFNGDMIQSFINGKQMKYFDTKKYKQFQRESVVIICTVILIVIAMIASIYVIKALLKPIFGAADAQTIASAINAVQIQVVNYLYSMLAVALNDRENHRTSTQYEDSMLVKLFAFQFVNSFSSFYYLAFIAETRGECPMHGCMPILATNLGIIFGSRLISTYMQEIFVPVATRWLRKHVWGRKIENLISRGEKEFSLLEYDDNALPLNSYAEAAIQFGFTTLFITALPMAATCAYVSNIIEMRGDSWKFLHLYQRPTPHGAEDIGTWQSVFTLIAIIAVVTNAGLSVFSMTTFNFLNTTQRFWIFIGFQWIIFGAQYMIAASIPDVPEEIDIQIKRTEYLVSKIIDKERDPVVEHFELPPSTLTISSYPFTRTDSTISQESPCVISGDFGQSGIDAINAADQTEGGAEFADPDATKGPLSLIELMGSGSPV